MNESERLAQELDKALNGGAWHGPSWREALDGITYEGAVTRPLPTAHTIAEIVLHATTWHDAVRRRLEGETPNVSDAEDWPAADVTTDEAWQAATTRLLQTGQALRDSMKRFPAERLQEKRPGLDESWYSLLIGELQHVLYHAGQVALLRKAVDHRQA